MAMQHGVDNMAAVGAQHAAVIAHRFTGRALDQTVDGARGQLTEQAVLTVLTDRADHVIAFVGFGHQARDLFRRVLQVRVQGDDQIARDVAKPRHNRRVLAVVTVEQHGYDVAAFNLRGFGQHQRGIIATAIIHQQNFVGLAHRVTGGRCTADQFGQALLLVINRDYHGYFLYRRCTEHINVLQADGVR